MHSKSQILDDLIEKNNGYLITADAVILNISKTYISSFITLAKFRKYYHSVLTTEEKKIENVYIGRRAVKYPSPV